MKRPRNPFRLRAAENIESDTTFLRLFGPVMLDVLSGVEAWRGARFLRSSAGGGKTSLMRLFTPPALLALHAQRTADDYKELHQRMQELGVIDDDGPQVLGVMLTCGHTYSTLADLDCDEAQRSRFLLALLDARIILALLRGALTLRKLDYPDDLSRLRIVPPHNVDLPSGLRLPCTGTDLYTWATQLEASVCNAIDSFGPIEDTALTGHDRLMSLSLLIPDWLTIDERPVAEHLLVLLDDAHKLTSKQRRAVVEDVMAQRAAVGVWIAERFESLSSDEMLASGALEGRDYSLIDLEGFWRKQGRRFEKLVLNVGDRRAHAAEIDIDSFSTCLEASLDGIEWQDRLARVADAVTTRVLARVAARPQYHEWLGATEAADGTPRERAVAWRMLEIRIERELKRSQLAFDFWPLSAEQLEDRAASGVKEAATLFLSRESGLPYYYGVHSLSLCASSNIEQFLWLAGDAFEELVSAGVIRQTQHLTPERQHAIIKNAAEARWHDIHLRIPDGRRLRGFLEAIGSYARASTYQPNAPYAPGVTGIAINMRERDYLLDPQYRRSHPAHAELAYMLGLALTHNLLEPVLDHKQGTIGDRWMVLYLNRFLCVYFDLPLQYGGWRPRRLKELSTWAEDGVKALKKTEGLLGVDC